MSGLGASTARMPGLYGIRTQERAVSDGAGGQGVSRGDATCINAGRIRPLDVECSACEERVARCNSTVSLIAFLHQLIALNV